MMKYEWVNIEKELPSVGELINIKFKVDLSTSYLGIRKGDILKVKVVEISGGEIVVTHKNEFRIRATVKDFSHWQKKIDPIKDRWEILDL